MSYYYNYYIGYRTADGMIYPLGPFDMNGVMHPALSKSRSFASDLHNDFYCIAEKDVSDELTNVLGYAWQEGKEKTFKNGKYLPLSKLSSGNFIKDGYFLISDVEHCLETGEIEFYDYISKEVYAARLQNEITFGPPLKETNEFDQDVTPRSCRDYMYFAYPDVNSREYESWIIRNAVEMLELSDRPKDSVLVIIETEG